MAAEASLAAGDQGKFRQMHEVMLRNSPKLDRASLLAYARDIGLDVRKFAESLDGKRHDDAIERDVRLAVSLDIFNTPTFFLNGRKIVGGRDYEFMKRAVDEELAAAKR